MKIAGLWSGHDCSFCILEDGRPVMHAEYERYIREKEPKGDSLTFLEDVVHDISDIDEFVSCHPARLISAYPSHSKLDVLGKRVRYFGHHQSHAAHAFFSSNINDALVLTVDGGGVEDPFGNETATTVWHGTDNRLNFTKVIPSSKANVGGLWTRVTRNVFRLQNGWPRGHQAGTVMAMAAMGDPARFKDDFARMLREDLHKASQKHPGQPAGAYDGNDPRHPYLGKWLDIADNSESDKFDLAAGLQAATEDFVRDFVIAPHIGTHTKICLAGGVALNSVLVGKIQDWFGQVTEVYVPPVPYDAGLTLGAAQYFYHHVSNKPRITWSDNFTPYLGESHNLGSELSARSDLSVSTASVADVINLLDQGHIVSIFNGRSESGRRALGNRSILADPRRSDMKEKINEKVKHRQWFRPFAPSIMREHVSSWFTRDVSSPYMTHVVKFRDEVKGKVPAVVHLDGSARLQTVTRNDNPWYYDLLEMWYQRTGVPILLNTSFNDREPIVQTPKHAIDCFMSTDIDYLFFVDEGIVVSRLRGDSK